MGKIKEGILGPFSGRVGPVVGSQWKGVAVIRSRPPLKRQKSSEGQLRQMAKMTLMSPFLHPLRDLLNRAYRDVGNRMSSFNKTLSYNMRNAVSGEYPAFTINYPRLVLGVGDLLNVDQPAVHSEIKGELRFDWTDNSGEGSAVPTDQAFAAIYCESLQQWITGYDGPGRNAASYTLDVAEFSGNAVQTYIGFLSADGKYVSTSIYTGMVNIL